MTPEQVQAHFAQATSESLNCLGVILCSTAFGDLYRSQPRDELEGWVAGTAAEAARLFDEVARRDPRVRRLRDPVSRLRAFGEGSIDLASAGQLADLRRAVRALFAALGMPIPIQPEGVACLLHGDRCPAPPQE